MPSAFATHASQKFFPLRVTRNAATRSFAVIRIDMLALRHTRCPGDSAGPGGPVFALVRRSFGPPRFPAFESADAALPRSGTPDAKASPQGKTPSRKGKPVVRRGRKATGQAAPPDSRVAEIGPLAVPR